MVLPTHGAQVLESQATVSDSWNRTTDYTLNGEPFYGENLALSSVATRSINDTSTQRYLKVTFPNSFYWGKEYDTFRGINGDEFAFTSGSIAYPTSFSYSSTGNNIIFVPANSYYDIYSYVDYRVADIGSLLVDGTYFTSVFSNSTNSAVYPNTAEMLINGQPVGASVQGSNGSFTFSEVEIFLTEDVSTLGLRFTFTSSANRTAADSTTDSTFRVGFQSTDNLTVTTVTPADEVYIPILTEILQAIRNLPNLIVGAFTLPDKQEQANQFQEDMGGAVSNMDNIKQEIEEGLEKPEPETIVPDIDIIVDTSDEYHVQYSEILSGLLSNAMITNLLLIVASMMFVSYVLFGKKG